MAGVAAIVIGTAAVASATLAAGQRKPLPSAAPSQPARVVRAAAPPATVEIAATGDIALDDVVPAGLFDAVRGPLAADVVLGNLEGTLTASGVSKCRPDEPDCFAFRAPPTYARAFRRAGFTVLNLANNHAYDYGAQGFAETVAALRRARLLATGQPGRIAVQRVGATRVAVLGFAPYPWAQSLLDVASAELLVRRAAARADIVVVTMHAGAEGADRMHVRPGGETYLGEPRGDVVAFARAAVRAGADLVVGHGPHVLRGMEWYRGRLIAYSLGNFAAHQTLDVSGVLGVSAILRVRLGADGSWAGGKLVGTRLVGGGVPTLDHSGAALTLVDRLSRQDFGARGVRVSPTAELVPPVS